MTFLEWVSNNPWMTVLGGMFVLSIVGGILQTIVKLAKKD